MKRKTQMDHITDAGYQAAMQGLSIDPPANANPKVTTQLERRTWEQGWRAGNLSRLRLDAGALRKDLTQYLRKQQQQCLHNDNVYVSKMLDKTDLVTGLAPAKRYFDVELICKDCGARLTASAEQKL